MWLRGSKPRFGSVLKPGNHSWNNSLTVIGNSFTWDGEAARAGGLSTIGSGFRKLGVSSETDR